jgi:hypothetical protein
MTGEKNPRRPWTESENNELHGCEGEMNLSDFVDETIPTPFLALVHYTRFTNIASSKGQVAATRSPSPD